VKAVAIAGAGILGMTEIHIGAPGAIGRNGSWWNCSLNLQATLAQLLALRLNILAGQDKGAFTESEVEKPPKPNFRFPSLFHFHRLYPKFSIHPNCDEQN